jgi:hypothetical protein
VGSDECNRHRARPLRRRCPAPHQRADRTPASQREYRGGNWPRGHEYRWGERPRQRNQRGGTRPRGREYRGGRWEYRWGAVASGARARHRSRGGGAAGILPVNLAGRASRTEPAGRHATAPSPTPPSHTSSHAHAAPPPLPPHLPTCPPFLYLGPAPAAHPLVSLRIGRARRRRPDRRVRARARRHLAAGHTAGGHCALMTASAFLTCSLHPSLLTWCTPGCWSYRWWATARLAQLWRHSLAYRPGNLPLSPSPPPLCFCRSSPASTLRRRACGRACRTFFSPSAGPTRRRGGGGGGG